MPDGSMLFTEQDADRIIKIDNSGTISTYLEHANRTVGLAYDHGRRQILVANIGDPAIAGSHTLSVVSLDDLLRGKVAAA